MRWADSRSLGLVVVPYSTSMTLDSSLGDYFVITVTDGVAYTINAPTNPPAVGGGDKITIEISNTSGGASGALTLNAAFLPAGAVTLPATGKRRTVTFSWNGTKWVETGRAAADI